MRTSLLQSCRDRGGEGGMQRTQDPSVTQWGGGRGSPHHPDRQKKEHSRPQFSFQNHPKDQEESSKATAALWECHTAGTGLGGWGSQIQ